MTYRMKYVVYCPKCKSEEADVSVEEPHPKVRKITNALRLFIRLNQYKGG